MFLGQDMAAVSWRIQMKVADEENVPGTSKHAVPPAAYGPVVAAQCGHSAAPLDEPR